jgi:hypothetical protein
MHAHIDSSGTRGRVQFICVYTACGIYCYGTVDPPIEDTPNKGTIQINKVHTKGSFPVDMQFPFLSEERTICLQRIKAKPLSLHNAWQTHE